MGSFLGKKLGVLAVPVEGAAGTHPCPAQPAAGSEAARGDVHTQEACDERIEIDLASPVCTTPTARGLDDNYFSPEERALHERAIPHTPPQLNRHTQWRKGELLGAGAYGKVFLAMNVDNGELMAVKQVFVGGGGERTAKLIRSLENEIQLMQSLTHRNIVRYWGTQRVRDEFHIFMEYVSGGSIATLLEKYGSFNEHLIRTYTRQILQGLLYLHSHRIMHRDIKGSNILVDGQGVIKLADFGSSRSLADLAEATAVYASLRGTPYWMAPEVVRQAGHGRQADIWSVGCTVIEMATGKPPWAQESQVAVLYHIATSADPPPFPDHLSEQCKDFLRLCFARDPAKRANAIALLAHPFVATEEDDVPSDVREASVRMLTASGMTLRLGRAVNTLLEPGGALHSEPHTAPGSDAAAAPPGALENSSAPAASPESSAAAEAGSRLDGAIIAAQAANDRRKQSRRARPNKFLFRYPDSFVDEGSRPGMVALRTLDASESEATLPAIMQPAVSPAPARRSRAVSDMPLR